MRGIGSLIEKGSAKIRVTEKKRTETNGGNPPLSRISNNTDTKSVVAIELKETPADEPVVAREAVVWG